jgi:hypothetical protein
VNVGDLIRCGDELGIVIERTAGIELGIGEEEFLTTPWLEIMWSDGDLDGIQEDDAEVICECG